MKPALKEKLVVVALGISGLAFLDGIALLCYCPGPFVFAVPFTLAAVFLSSRCSIRVVAVCLCAASIAMAVHQFERKQQLDSKMKAIHEDTSSITE